MSSPAPFDDIKARLIAANLGLPIAWPNEVFKKPNPPGPWLAVAVTANHYAPIELGGGGWMEEGTALIEVVVPVGSGSGTARAIAKAVADVFRGVPAQPVVYLGGSIGDGQVDDPDGVWWCIMVAIDWRYQDTSFP